MYVSRQRGNDPGLTSSILHTYLLGPDTLSHKIRNKKTKFNPEKFKRSILSLFFNRITFYNYGLQSNIPTCSTQIQMTLTGIYRLSRYCVQPKLQYEIFKINPRQWTVCGTDTDYVLSFPCLQLTSFLISNEITVVPVLVIFQNLNTRNKKLNNNFFFYTR